MSGSFARKQRKLLNSGSSFKILLGIANRKRRVTLGWQSQQSLKQVGLLPPFRGEHVLTALTSHDRGNSPTSILRMCASFIMPFVDAVDPAD